MFRLKIHKKVGIIVPRVSLRLATNYGQFQYKSNCSNLTKELAIGDIIS